jgi:hypothetical protein
MIVQLELAPTHVISAYYSGAIALSLGYRYPLLINRIVSIEGSVIKPDALPADGMSVLFKYPLIGDLFILLVRSGWLNRVFMPLITGYWYPHMTPADRRKCWSSFPTTRVRLPDTLGMR